MQDHLGLTKVLCGDRSKDVGGHHAHRWSTYHLVGKGTDTVAQNDAGLIGLDKKKITLNTALEVDQNVDHLCLIEFVCAQRVFVLGIYPLSNALTNDADEARRFIDAYNGLKSSSKLTHQRSQENISLKRDIETGYRCGFWIHVAFIPYSSMTQGTEYPTPSIISTTAVLAVRSHRMKNERDQLGIS